MLSGSADARGVVDCGHKGESGQLSNAKEGKAFLDRMRDDEIFFAPQSLVSKGMKHARSDARAA